MVTIRKAEKADAQTLVDLIKGLAVYEKLEQYVVVTAHEIEQTLFCDNPKVFAIIAEVAGENNEKGESEKQVAGFALYFFNYSTFLGKHGIYLEDLFVKPDFRSQKVGFELFKSLGQVAKENDCGRIDWAVLDWNQLAIDFYDNLGARAQTEWTGYRLDGTALTRLQQM